MSDQKKTNELLSQILNRKWLILAAVGLVVIVGLVIALTISDDDADSQTPTAVVIRGPMVISVTEGGELESERRKIISNELRWPVIIREVVDEGTVVKKDQVIIEFECKELLDAITEEELRATTAKNNHAQAEQNLQLKKEEMANKVLKAKRTLEEAREDRDKYNDHEYPILVFERDSAVISAEGNLEIAKKSLQSKININKKMKEDSPYSSSEIKADTLKVQGLENTLEKNKLEKKKLDEYDHPRRLRDLEAGASDAKLASKRAKLEAKGQLLNSKSDVQAKKRTLDMRVKKLKELREDEKKLIVKAEKEGLVVYQTGRRGRRPTDVVIAKGEKINPRQQLMMIPDMSTIQINTKVYEAVIQKIKPGLEAFIRLDISPNKPLKGKVKKVGVLANSQRGWLNPGLKTYTVIVTFDEKPIDLKPGLTCQVELVVERLVDVIYVPIASIFTEEDKIICYRADTNEPVEVKIGGMNDTHAQILSGLAEGDEVLLVKPGLQAVKDNRNGEKNKKKTPLNGGSGA